MTKSSMKRYIIKVENYQMDFIPSDDGLWYRSNEADAVITSLQVENKDLRKDAERLELCIKLRSFPREYFKSYNPTTDSLGWKWFYPPKSGYQKSARDCIDLALAYITKESK